MLLACLAEEKHRAKLPLGLLPKALILLLMLKKNWNANVLILSWPMNITRTDAGFAAATNEVLFFSRIRKSTPLAARKILQLLFGDGPRRGGGH